ncbi:MAG: hypothetical protein QF809_02735 [Candidatus Peribacteraceae bacterium]|nr:hypothetical protein [Candidatus Peribacteraceae bacterium]MDP7645556.1 hypothetical protein [Candidatus Peribacteraceae bacterium]
MNLRTRYTSMGYKVLTKIFSGILVVSLIALFGCSKPITQEEAEEIAKDYVISEFGPTSVGESLSAYEAMRVENDWHIKVLVGDDKGLAIIGRKGKVIKFESYIQ